MSVYFEAKHITIQSHCHINQVLCEGGKSEVVERKTSDAKVSNLTSEGVNRNRTAS